MNHFTKIMCIVIAMLLVVSFAACGDDGKNAGGKDSLDGTYKVIDENGEGEVIIKGSKISTVEREEADREEMLSELELDDDADVRMFEALSYEGTFEKNEDGTISAKLTSMLWGMEFEGKDAKKAKEAYLDYLDSMEEYAEDDEMLEMLNAMRDCIKTGKMIDYELMTGEKVPEFSFEMELNRKDMTGRIISTAQVDTDEYGEVSGKTVTKFDDKGQETESISYDLEGNITTWSEREYYENGNEKHWVRYDENGQKRDETESYENGQTKIYISYYDGKIQWKDLYDEDGVHIETIRYDENGNEIQK